MQRFEELVSYHRQLDEMLLQHQEALVLMRPEAHGLYQKFTTMLKLHIKHEDQLLLPVFQRDQNAQRWPSMLYFKEHRKLEDFLGRIEVSLQNLSTPTPQRVRRIIELLDLEGGLKRLLEHHDIREQKDFFPVLDQITDEQERSDLLARINREWQDQLNAETVQG